mmetsp:Transcript_1244/g.1641  ORF Transcript_1244/g.1641 Transcript_1244/m.1641 type:complete len:466 (-) Transcript_1244:167-1564(-)|eukprot:CAMPEP_0198138636 /NCGR_PEP_ID=MMETSP1443-20131203/2026_1 /TAXON_ID=186043 /ORGANISM="Entomoneis sp., Strain CCMP2396" /LENGTH=465 /DNA_ID=CAMNT_0043800499 /DNA_START=129 /DNA_END=1526 /DNA_ORIENTATION=-
MSNNGASTTTSAAAAVSVSVSVSVERDDLNLFRVGILGCASIAKKNAMAIFHPASGCTVTAVASRTLDKANAFVNEFVKPGLGDTTNCQVFGGANAYNDLIEWSSSSSQGADLIDALYIPLPTTLHKEWVIKALTKAKKHVLLEKPTALNEADYQEMLLLAKEQGKFLLDGTMFVHHSRTRQFLKTVHNQNVMGDLKRIESGFSFFADQDFSNHNIRVQKSLDPLGCLGDLGWYQIRMALLVFSSFKENDNDNGNYYNNKLPVLMSAQVVDCTLNQEGVPMEATCLVKFGTGNDDNDTNKKTTVLSFHCGFEAYFRQYLHVVGTKSGAFIDDFVLPKKQQDNNADSSATSVGSSTPSQSSFRVESMSLTDHDIWAVANVETFHDDVENTPVVVQQEVLMWQCFSRLARAIDNTNNNGGGSNGWGKSQECMEAAKLTETSILNQRVLDALMTSIQEGCSKVDFDVN